MTMRPVSTTIGIVSAALLSLTVWGSIGLTNHIIIAVDRWGNAAPDLKPTLDAISGPRGTLHEVNKAAVKIGDAIVQTQLVERATAPHITAAMDTLNDSSRKLGWTADSLSGTATALTGTANTATDTLAESQRTIAATQPLLAQLTANGASLQATTDSMNDVLKRKAIGDTLDNLAGITGHADAIIGDGQRVSDKLTADYFKPLPWWKVPAKRAGEFWDIGAALARHTP